MENSKYNQSHYTMICQKLRQSADMLTQYEK